jgi:hypothetical protein
LAKRSTGKFPRADKDKYRTPLSAALPLLDHLKPCTRFIECCAGEGDLIDHLTAAGHILVSSSDAEIDATVARYDVPPGVMFVTNPPWRRDILHPLIINLSDQAPTWLLFDSDWVHTQQAFPFLPRLRTVVSTGRHRWIPGTKHTAKDNTSWHLFGLPIANNLTRFIGRTERARGKRSAVVVADTNRKAA